MLNSNKGTELRDIFCVFSSLNSENKPFDVQTHSNRFIKEFSEGYTVEISWNKKYGFPRKEDNPMWLWILHKLKNSFWNYGEVRFLNSDFITHAGLSYPKTETVKRISDSLQRIATTQIIITYTDPKPYHTFHNLISDFWILEEPNLSLIRVEQSVLNYVRRGAKDNFSHLHF
jgi:hypothetical protein